MNRKIAIIIATDFCCWVPFITICVLHSLEVFDATPWYGLFSMIILPINSVINPLLYDDAVTSFLKIPCSCFMARISNTATYLTSIAFPTALLPEEMEMEQVVVRVEGTDTNAPTVLRRRREEEQPIKDKRHRNVY